MKQDPFFLYFDDTYTFSKKRKLSLALSISIFLHIFIFVLFCCINFFNSGKDTPTPKTIVVHAVRLSPKLHKQIEKTALAQANTIPQKTPPKEPTPKEELPPPPSPAIEPSTPKEEPKPQPTQQENNAEIRPETKETIQIETKSAEKKSSLPTPKKKIVTSAKAKGKPSDSKPQTKASTKKISQDHPSSKAKSDQKQKAAQDKATKELAESVQSLIAQSQLQRKKATASTSKGNSGTPCGHITSLSFENNAADEADSPGDQEATAEELYVGNLIRLIQLSLTIPDKEPVVLKLTLARSGHIKTLTIISSPSSRNRHAVEKGIMSLRFPSFGLAFKRESDRTFSLRLTREMEWMSMTK